MSNRDGIPTSRVRRAVVPAAFGARAAAGNAAAWAGGLLRGRDRRLERQLSQAIRTAEQAADLMGGMKGAVMKMGQLLSFADAGVLPPEVQQALARLQADAPPMALPLVEQVVTAELGALPAEVFEWFSPLPMAAASIGQVHAARTREGREVVVKVQYPGVADAITADLDNTALITQFLALGQSFLRSLGPRVDLRALADEVRDRVVEELDYEHELRSQQVFADLWRADPAIRIPEVVPELSARRVLTMEHVDAMRWQAALEHPKELRDRWGQAIFRFVFTSLYRHRIFNADPHPGNYLFHEDGSVTFLDFGCTRLFTDDQVDQLQRLAGAIADQDADRLTDELVEAGFLRDDRGLDRGQVLEYLTQGYEPILADQPFTYSREFAQEAVRRQLGLASDYLRLAWRFDLPPHFLFLGRITVGVGSVLTALEATGDWRAIMEGIWAEGEAEG